MLFQTAGLSETALGFNRRSGYYWLVDHIDNRLDLGQEPSQSLLCKTGQLPVRDLTAAFDVLRYFEDYSHRAETAGGADQRRWCREAQLMGIITVFDLPATTTTRSK